MQILLLAFAFTKIIQSFLPRVSSSRESSGPRSACTPSGAAGAKNSFKSPDDS